MVHLAFPMKFQQKHPMTDTIEFEDLSPEFLSKSPAYDGHEKVRRAVLDAKKGIVALIAVHNSNLGPALGGCRIIRYASEEAALYDVLRLSKGMTYKNAMAGLPLGGGKAVIIMDAKTEKTPELMARFGALVETLDGLYVTAEDSGSNENDMEAIRKSTAHVTGLHPETLKAEGYPSLGGNPSPLTALGCFEGIKAAVKHRYGRDDIKGLRFAVQGIGAVGLALSALLKNAGGELVIADINDLNIAAAKKVLGEVEVVGPQEIYTAEADVFVPCALGGVLNDDTIVALHAEIVAGPANNQLLEPRHDAALTARGITYVPDYVINAGGVICVGYEYFMTSGKNVYGFSLTEEAMTRHVVGIGTAVSDILSFAKENLLNTGDAADRLAEDKFSSSNPEAINPESPNPKSLTSCA